MSDNRESLCDLVELRAAEHRIPLARLWERVFAVIRDGELGFGFPEEFEAEYGGRNPAPHYASHIRKTLCVNALFAIENGDAFPPWGQLWVRRMLVSAAAFDRALLPASQEAELQPSTAPAPEKQAGRRGPERGTVGYGASDLALHAEIDKLIPQNSSAWAACLQLATEGRIAGNGTIESKAKRLLSSYNRRRKKLSENF